jgi:hypothetical protein
MGEKPVDRRNRRIDHILGPGFSQGLGDLDMDEIRRRRDLCRAEREYLSYLRRLLQGRRDILRDELDRRRAGGERGTLVERLTAVLADAPRGPSRGEALMVSVPEEEILLARRRVERLVSDSRLSDLDALSEDDLEATIAGVEEEERTISDTRARVLTVHDLIQDELKRRYRAQLGGLKA